MQSALRMVILKVMYENGIDVFVNPEQTTAPYKLGYAGEPEVNDRPQISCCTAFTALGGMPEMDVPAGFTTISYDSQYELNADKTDYVEVTGQVESKMPPMPVSMMFWSGPGSDAAVIKAGSAYESATHHRKPPPAFGPVPARPGADVREPAMTAFLRTVAVLSVLAPAAGTAGAQTLFRIEESTIADVQNAIKSGQTTCRAVVQAYLDRAKAYNGTCTALVTADGAPIPPAKGAVRAGAPITFPTTTVPVAKVFPDFSEYAGRPFEFGRMEPTISDPSVQQQFGMRVGIPNAGQLDALETLNLRGERSITCKGDYDRAPSAGPLPPGAPPECEAFRQQPDALERAAELDAKYGRNPDLTKLPLYCAVFSLKNWYDAKDMRATGGNDINFAMDAPKVDSPDIAALRAKGAVIYAVATANNIGGPSARGAANAPSVLPDGNLAYGAWGGQTCNPYDTERVPRGTSGGSGTSVAANLVACSICEQSWASCKGPASRNNVVNLLTTKGILHGRRHDGEACRRPRRHPLPYDAGCGDGARRDQGIQVRRLLHGDPQSADTEGAVHELPGRR